MGGRVGELGITRKVFLLSNLIFPCVITYPQESNAWLELWTDLEGRGTVICIVCITHDRYLLNNIAEWMLELDRGKGYPHSGNYL
jgi:ABC-type ATPase involved in cell division